MMKSDTYTALLVQRSGSVLEITLNRPEVRNALDETLIAEMTHCVTRAYEGEGTRALVFRGAGASFCAGADLHWMARAATYTYEENLEDARTLQRLFAAIAHFPGVTIAVAQGAAIGGGVGLAAACDIVLAVEPVVFGLSEVRLGLVPAMIAPYVLEKIGVGAARSLFVTGERIDGTMAHRIGLVQHVAPTAREADELLVKILGQILRSGPDAVAAAKRLIRDIAGRTAADAADLTADCIAKLRVSAEGQEGIRAFLEKRTPSFVEAIPAPEDPT